MEKGGLAKALAAHNCPSAAGTFWGDEMRLGLIGQLRRVWAPRGVKVEQEQEFSYQWAYLNLAVNSVTGKLHWSWTKNMKSASLAPVLQSFSLQGVEAMVWDGAKGHHGAAYDDVSVRRIFQPPHSPQLNPAEWVFELIRARIEGKVYGSLSAKQAAVEAELAELAADPDRVKRLTGWQWIRRALAALDQPNVALE